MILSTVHVHSNYCDGKNSMAEMAEEAYKLGLKSIGFSGHSYTEHDNFGMNPSIMPEYIAEAKRLRKLYEGQMDVLCGMELDAITSFDPGQYGLDYLIGSVHSVRGDDGGFYVIDGNIKRFEENVRVAYGGSFEDMYEAYYKQLADFIIRVKPDIVGHFDLVTKYNEKYGYFDSESDRYKKAALTALDAVLDVGTAVEINTGAMTRGYRTAPYPAEFLLKHILKRDGKVIITSDTHSVTTILSHTSEAEELLKGVGFSKVWEMDVNGFYERAL